MRKIRIKIRKKGWSILNDLYNIPKKLSLEKVYKNNPLLLMKDAFFIDSPHFIIEVGYYPGPRKKKELQGEVIKNCDWDNPIERVLFKNIPEAKIWIKQKIKQVEGYEKKFKSERYLSGVTRNCNIPLFISLIDHDKLIRKAIKSGKKLENNAIIYNTGMTIGYVKGKATKCIILECSKVKNKVHIFAEPISYKDYAALLKKSKD